MKHNCTIEDVRRVCGYRRIDKCDADAILAVYLDNDFPLIHLMDEIVEQVHLYGFNWGTPPMRVTPEQLVEASKRAPLVPRYGFLASDEHRNDEEEKLVHELRDTLWPDGDAPWPILPRRQLKRRR